MKAMILTRVSSLPENRTPLIPADLPIPEPGKGEILVRISACGVCQTEVGRQPGFTGAQSGENTWGGKVLVMS